MRDGARRLGVADPTGLLDWLSGNRAMITFGKGNDVKAVLPALKAIMGQWIKHV